MQVRFVPIFENFTQNHAWHHLKSSVHTCPGPLKTCPRPAPDLANLGHRQPPGKPTFSKINLLYLIIVTTACHTGTPIILNMKYISPEMRRKLIEETYKLLEGLQFVRKTFERRCRACKWLRMYEAVASRLKTAAKFKSLALLHMDCSKIFAKVAKVANC